MGSGGIEGCLKLRLGTENSRLLGDSVEVHTPKTRVPEARLVSKSRFLSEDEPPALALNCASLGCAMRVVSLLGPAHGCRRP